MCCRPKGNYKARILAWWGQPINPLFLTIRDAAMQEKFEENLQLIVKGRIGGTLILLWSYMGLFTMGNLSDLKSHLVVYMTMGTACVATTIVYLLVLWKKRFFSWICVSLISTRFLIIILTCKLIEQQTPGLETVDLKQMNNSIFFFSLPMFLLTAYDLRIELCLTLPLAMFANHWTIGTAFTDTESNMDGFLDPMAFARHVTFRSTVLISLVVYCVYDNRRNQIRHFMG